jgi:predicted transcriptional regulator
MTNIPIELERRISNREQFEIVREIIANAGPDGLSKEELAKLAREKGISKDNAVKWLKRLSNNGEVYQNLNNMKFRLSGMI